MSVKIRLAKVGKKHQISYRIVAIDTRTKRDGRFLEILGHFNPQNEIGLNIKRARADYWIQKGAKPTKTVAKILEESVNQNGKQSKVSQSQTN